jgi:tetratricopeptide (TPR) repeat protein
MPFEPKNRQIRVFISSTFTDMQREREVLIKQIFPQIRTLCRQREVEFREVDLRWGVTEEAKLDAAVQICLQEINQCHPFFIGLLGERYGKVHPPEKFQALHEVHSQLAWLKGYPDQSSVTDLEIQQAVFQSGVPVEELAKTMHFYFRDPKSADSVKYREEENSPGWGKLRQLKAKICASGLPVTEYFNSAELSKLVLEHLTQVINRLFPEGSQPTRLEKEAWEHEAFARSRTLAYIPRRADFQRLEEHVASEEALPLVIVGESGIGKSALLANWALDYRQRQPQAKVIFHFIGSSPYSTDVVTMLKRIMGELKQHYPLALSQEIPAAPEEVVKQLPLWLASAGPGRTILILDGLNQLSGDGQSLTWLPEFIPAHIRLLVSTLPEKVDRPQWSHFEVTALSEEERLQLIPTFLGVWSKALSPGRVKAIATAPQTANPLYLRVLLEELRVFGSHDQLKPKIDDYLAASSVTALYQKVLRRLEEDYGEELVQRAFRLLWAARRGITESELLEMLPVSITTSWPYLYLAVQEALVNRGGVLNFFHDYLRQAVEGSYLATVEAQQEAHLALADYFEKQPLTARVADEWPWQLAQAKAWERLKGCISGLSMFMVLYGNGKEYELLSYWVKVGGTQLMAEVYLNQYNSLVWKWRFYRLGRLFHLVKLNLELEWFPVLAKWMFAFFRTARVEEETVETSYRLQAKLQKLIHPNRAETAESLSQLATLLHDKGDYVQAEPLYRRALAIRQQVLGENHPDTALSLNNLAALLDAKGDYGQAKPLFRRALAIREQVLGENHPDTAISLGNLAGSLEKAKGDYVQAELLRRRGLAIHEQVLGENHPDTATSLNNLAGLLQAKGDYVPAEPLCRRALAIREQVLGENHPKTALSLNSLAVLLGNNGDYVQADPLHRRALKILEEKLGVKHPHTVGARNNLEDCLMMQMTTNLGQHEVERSDPSLSSPVAVFGTAAKPSRNAPCPCGSGKRVKECCGKVK